MSMAEARSRTGSGIVVDTDAAVASEPGQFSNRGPVTDGAEVAAEDTTGIVGTETERETFIPLTRFAIMDRLTRESAWPPNESAAVQKFFKFLAAWRHQTYAIRLLKLKEAYLPFSPDRDTVRTMEYTPEQQARLKRRLIKYMTCLLEQANYRQVSRQQLDDIFAEDSSYGLDLEVDLSEFEELMIFCRGSTIAKKERRTWRKFYLGFEEYEIPIFQRLFLLLKLKSEEERINEIMKAEDVNEQAARKKLKRLRNMLPPEVSAEHVYLKLFKQIPRADMQMMFPNTKVQFRPLDKIKLGVTAGGGTVASVATTASKILIATNPIKAAFALLGLAGVVLRQVMKFFNQRNQYMMVLAQNLYFHNLADNRGVLTLLSDRAEEEDIKEEMLLYALLAKEPLMEDDLEEARVAIEQYLEQEFGVRVHYDLEDALSRLKADKVVIRTDAGLLRALSPYEGCEHIDRMWDDYLNTADFFNSTEDELQAA